MTLVETRAFTAEMRSKESITIISDARGTGVPWVYPIYYLPERPLGSSVLVAYPPGAPRTTCIGYG